MKISIVIPTRNRSEFLRYCVQTCLASDDPDIEVIVSDNNSVDDTRSCIESLQDPRLTYVNTGRDLSMRQNFESALDHTTGDYVIYIGDDDGIIPNGLATLRGVLGRDQPDVALWRHITYDWPRGGGGEDAFPGRLKFRFRDFCGPIKRIDPVEVFHGFCRGDRINYREGANIYHGCVHRRVIDKVRRAQDGVYFNGLSPDVNTALSNLIYSKSIVWLRNPVTIAGAGEKSNGYAYNSSVRTSATQEKVASDFTRLITTDRLEPEIDIRIRPIPAHTYANLCKAQRLHGRDASIDHAAWRHAIYASATQFLQDGLNRDVLEAFFAQMDPGYHPPHQEQRPEPQQPQAETNARDVKAPKRKARRGVAPSSQLENVAMVVDWLQAVTGKPYVPSHNKALSLTRQTGKIAAMWFNTTRFNPAKR